MPTLFVLSDLHIGPTPSAHAFFRGRHAIAPALRALALRHGDDLHLVLNGDAFDFLMATPGEALEFVDDRACAAMRAILDGEDGSALVDGLAAVAAAGGALTVRLGNHDPELRSQAVRTILEEEVRKRVERLEPQRGRKEGADLIGWDDTLAQTFRVGSSNVCVTHGEAGDTLNCFDYDRAGRPTFVYPPGSFVVRAMQQARVKFELAFLDSLKPDYEGALLTALLIEPGILRLLPTRLGMRLAMRFARWVTEGPRGLTEGVDRAWTDVQWALRGRPDGLAETEVQVDLEALIAAAEAGKGLWDRASRTALWKAALTRTLPFLRRLAAEKGEEFFDLTPDRTELDSAWEMFDLGATVVVSGHTHAPRFWNDGGRAYLNTGTWGGLMRLPAADASEDEWTGFYDRVRAREKDWPPVFEMYTGARVHAASGGTQVELLRWRDGAWKVASHTESATTLTSSARSGPRALAEGDTSVQAVEVAPRIEAWKARINDPRRAVPRSVVDAFLTGAALSREAGDTSAAAAQLDLLDRIAQQRRDPTLLRTLQAADVLGLAFQQHVFAQVSKDLQEQQPLRPVAWIESVASPLAWNRGSGVPSPSLAAGGLLSLPFQVILVPTDHIARPWRILSVLHEVGHAIDEVLHLSADLAQRLPNGWKRWAEELTADALAVGAAGVAFIRVLDWIIHGIRAVPRRMESEYPPTKVRLALLEALVGADLGYRTAAAGEAETADIEGIVRSGAFAPILRFGSFPHDLLTVLSREPLAQSTEPSPSAEASAGVRESLASLPDDDENVQGRVLNFLQGQSTRFAPASVDATGSLAKLPRVDLMLRGDHLFFIGAMHGNLVEPLRKARIIRKSPWETLEIFFVGRDADLPDLYPNRWPELQVEERQRRLLDERTRNMRALAAALAREDFARCWAIYSPVPGGLYGSIYLRRDPTGRAPDYWYAHTSAPVWGSGIGAAPSTDYQAISDTLLLDPEIAAFVAGLEHLRRGHRESESGPPILPWDRSLLRK